MDNKPLISADLNYVIEHGRDYPLAYLAALQLKPLLDDLVTSDFRAAPTTAGKHTDALAPSSIPPEVMDTVRQATVQLQEHLFDLQKLKIRHPEQESYITEQLDETRKVSGALVDAVSVITQFKGMPQNKSHAARTGHSHA